MRRKCKLCGCYLDPGEWCDCEDEQTVEVDMPRRAVAPRRTVYPREWNSEEYLRQKWLEFDLR